MNNAIYRKDYTPVIWQTRRINLVFELHPTATRVIAHQYFQRINEGDTLVLNGEGLTTHIIRLAGRQLGSKEYRIEDNHLYIQTQRDEFELEIETELNPSDNLSLSGLYMSEGYFCTQCEAEGFRRIMWSQDRPDNLSIYDVELRADANQFPVLLSNGNPGETGQLGNGRAYARWHDPHPKPSYLFALVAGDLAHIEDSFTTMNGRVVTLRIYSLNQYLNQCDFAMGALKRSMRWDEEQYGREYDLDVFNIVATDDFNMGAMENKGLNIFNTKLILADKDTADDQAFIDVEAVVAHEYFHNWSGNRVTCRDWFQLSLKEGFTVFRDQQFTADMHSAGTKRVADVAFLRTVQFKEDAGPLSHSVRPDSYESINNFYTVTIYEKGAEIVRMLYNILGAETFRTGCDHYFNIYDGTAATCDDFIACMEEASGMDLQHFSRWYFQAGTPVVEIDSRYDGNVVEIEVTQRTPPTANQPEKAPLFIPVETAFFNDDGKMLNIRTVEGCQSRIDNDGSNVVLYLSEAEHRIRVETDGPVKTASYLRGFSAPIKVLRETSLEEDAFLALYERDSFAAWEAGRQIYIKHINDILLGKKGNFEEVSRFVEKTITNAHIDDAFKAGMLLIPSTDYLMGLSDSQVDPKRIAEHRYQLHSLLAQDLAPLWCHKAKVTQEEYDLSNEQIGRRSMARLAFYMTSFLPSEGGNLAEAYFASHNMTERSATLYAILCSQSEERFKCLSEFYNRAKPYPVVLNSWFSLQIDAAHEDALKTVHALMNHPDYNEKNPNRLRSVIGSMTRNPWAFHHDSGNGYMVLAETIGRVDQFNPETAAFLARAFAIRPKLIDPLAHKMGVQVKRLLMQDGLSANVSEILTKVVADA